MAQTWICLIGGGAAIGKLTGKVIDYGVHVKRCSICQIATKQNKPIPIHKYYNNYTGSSKSMESSIGVAIAKNIRTKGATARIVTMDEDVTTIKEMKEE